MLRLNFGSAVNGQKVIAIVHPNSAPIKRAIAQKEEKGLLVDATMGKKVRAAVFMDSGHVVLSSVVLRTLATRFESEVEKGFEDVKRLTFKVEKLLQQLKNLGGKRGE